LLNRIGVRLIRVLIGGRAVLKPERQPAARDERAAQASNVKREHMDATRTPEVLARA
jgi:hypothetical protein